MIDPPSLLFLFIIPRCVFSLLRLLPSRHVSTKLNINHIAAGREQRAQSLVVQCRRRIVLHPRQWLADAYSLA